MAKQTGIKQKQGADLSRFMTPVAEPEKPKRTARRAPTPKQIKAAKLMAENVRNDKPKTQGEILKEAGYSDTIATTPSKIIQSDSFQDLLATVMPDNDLADIHKRLLSTRKIEHMVFPLEHGDPDDMFKPLPVDEALREQEINDQKRIIDNLSDEDIVDMLLEVNCVVRKIIHGETARHVYFWAHDAKAQHAALELVYKLKGHLNKEGGGGGDIFAFFGNNTANFVKKAEGKS